MLYFETSATEGVSVNEAFVDMVKMGIKRESSNDLMMPDSIGGAGSGGIKLQAKGRNNQAKVKSNGCC